jgi:transposase
MAKTRRTFTPEFKAEAVRRIADQGKSPAEVAELRRLRAEVKRLTMERDVLKKATAFFARESS